MSARAAIAAVVVALAAGPAFAQGPPPSPSMDVRFLARASITPGRAGLGERVVYRGIVVIPEMVRVQWVPPDTGGDFTWGPLTAARVEAPTGASGGRGPWGFDSVTVSVPLQVFRTGSISVPGLRFQMRTGAGGAVRIGRLPVTRLEVVPVTSAADTALRPPRGPLAAPWWERVPWPWVIGVALALVLIALLWRAWRRRRRVAAPALAPAVAARRGPLDELLAGLAALRLRALPEHGRFGEHALELTALLKRFLEQTLIVPRPGDTTPELVQRLAGPLDDAERARVEGLLRLWDRVKFARAPLTVAEAHRAEQVVEAFARERARPASPRSPERAA